jgi:SAM-dependent methyltransferase
MTDILRPTFEEACAAWAARVRADREQVDRLREAPDGDFYGPVASAFKANPERSDDPVLDILTGLVEPGETWLDIGAGGGRFSLPIALKAGQVIAVEPSEGMLGVLREGMTEHGITNIDIHNTRWPSPDPIEADCSLISLVGNDIEDIGPFIEAMEASTRRMCTFVNLEVPPASAFRGVWLDVHGEPRAVLPSLPEFLGLLLARGRLFEMRIVERGIQSFEDPEHVLVGARRQTWVEPGSEKDRILQQSIRDRLQERDGRYAFSWAPMRIGIVTWFPHASEARP